MSADLAESLQKQVYNYLKANDFRAAKEIHHTSLVENIVLFPGQSVDSAQRGLRETIYYSFEKLLDVYRTLLGVQNLFRQ